ARSRRPDARVPAGDDPREVSAGRRPLVGDRDHEPGQPLVRTQRRSERGGARPGGYRALAVGFQPRPGAEPRWGFVSLEAAAAMGKGDRLGRLGPRAAAVTGVSNYL